MKYYRSHIAVFLGFVLTLPLFVQPMHQFVHTKHACNDGVSTYSQINDKKQLPAFAELQKQDSCDLCNYQFIRDRIPGAETILGIVHVTAVSIYSEIILLTGSPEPSIVASRGPPRS